MEKCMQLLRTFKLSQIIEEQQFKENNLKVNLFHFNYIYFIEKKTLWQIELTLLIDHNNQKDDQKKYSTILKYNSMSNAFISHYKQRLKKLNLDSQHNLNSKNKINENQNNFVESYSPF